MDARLGVIGAGLLGDALAKTWLARTGEAPLVWSRRLGTDWSRILRAQSIAIAIPGKALLDLVEDSARAREAARQFTGNVFSAAASLSQQSLQRAFPRATAVCIGPFLIDGVNSIPMLVLRPSDLPVTQWEKARAELEKFGEIDVVEDEEIFAQISLLGASFPAVVLAAVKDAADAGLQNLEDPAAIEIGQRIFYRAVRSLLANSGTQTEIVTPGGITERGLTSLGDMTSLFETVFKRMRQRAEDFRV